MDPHTDSWLLAPLRFSAEADGLACLADWLAVTLLLIPTAMFIESRYAPQPEKISDSTPSDSADLATPSASTSAR